MPKRELDVPDQQAIEAERLAKTEKRETRKAQKEAEYKVYAGLALARMREEGVVRRAKFVGGENQRVHFSRAEIMRFAGVACMDWNALTLAFDKMEGVSLGNSKRRGWFLDAPGTDSGRIANDVLARDGFIRRTATRLDAQAEAGKLPAVLDALGITDAAASVARTPMLAEILGKPMSEQSTKLLQDKAAKRAAEDDMRRAGLLR